MNTISCNSMPMLPLNIPSNSRGGICISCLGHSSRNLSNGHNGASLETQTSRYFWRSLKFLQGKVRSRNSPRVQFGRETFPQKNVVLGLFTRLCKEGLHLYRCSVFFAVISSVCLLAWYGQERAKNLIEKKLLPSVCSIIGEHIQREVKFGKVQRISPLSITVESCTIGPHKEEFSCAELPSLKLQFHPFASLRKGKIVIDAVLSHPTVLVAQKEDYTWLGVPSTGRVYQRRLSVEEGIDHRTRVQRIRREEAGARWTRERAVAAKNAAETGYFVRDHCYECASSDEGLNSRRLKETTLMSENSFAHGDYQHCMNGVDECHMKHSDLEKPFGINVRKLRLNFWPGILPWHPKHTVKRNTDWNDLSAGTADTKRVLLERSSCVAVNYFHGVLDGSNINPYRGRNSVYGYIASENIADKCSSYEAREDSGKQNTIVSNMDALNNGVKETAETLKHKGGGTFSDSETNLDFEHHDLKSDHDPYSPDSNQGEEAAHAKSVKLLLPVVLESFHLKGGTLMMLAYGDREAREIEIVSGHVKFLDHYSRFYAHMEGSCKKWRSDLTSEKGGSLSVDAFVDILEQRWHVNLKVVKLFVPLFERILEIPISWLEGRASGEIHICMSKNETFPNLHGQLEVIGLCFQIQDAPSCFTNCSATLLFRGQRIFLHNASALFGNVPLEASGDFGIHPEEGEFHIMCQVPSVDVNTLLKTFKMRPFLFPVAGSVSAIFNCQGPLDAPIFVGSSMISRKMHYSNYDASASLAYEAVKQNKDGGAVAAFDRVPFSYLSANYTFSTDNCVADLYGIRACLVDGGEIRGAGNVWMCPEGEIDDSAIDVNLSGSLFLVKILSRYIPGHKILSVNLGDLNGEAKLSGSLLRPRFDIKWVAPRAGGSFSDARGDIIISHDNIVVNSSSQAFELCSKFLTSYPEVESLKEKDSESKIAARLLVTGIELDLHMHGFDLFGLLSFFPIDSPKAVYLKSTGRIKFQGKIQRQCIPSNKSYQVLTMTGLESAENLVGEVTISGFKLNQLMVAPHLIGSLSFSDSSVKLDATGRPDEKVLLEIQGPFKYNCKGNLFSAELLFFSLHKGPLEAHLCYRPLLFGSLEVRHLPLDELELGSLRGTIQRAEIQLNFQKRRGHGMLSVLKPKFSGVLGEALDLAARWSGDVVTVEKTVLEQSCSRYEFQGEYVFPGVRDRVATGEEKCNLLKKAMAGHLGSAISSMGRWRLRLEVPQAEVAEMLPLARLLSRSIDPSVRSRSKDIFIQRLHSVGLYSERIQDLLEVIQSHCTQSDEVFVLEDANLPGLTELRGSWQGSLVASGGGNGDTMAEFDLHGDDWEWGTYKTQRVLAIGAYSSDDGLHIEKVFVQMDNATIHGDGTLLGLQPNFHFAVLNFPVGLVPMFVQVIESSAVDAVDALKTLLTPIKGILHMEGDLSGSFARPECDVKVRLLDGAVGGIDLGRAEIVASVTRSSRFNFNAKIEPAIQSGHVHIQGSVPLTFMVNDLTEDKSAETYGSGSMWIHRSTRERTGEILDESVEKKVFQDRNEEGWDIQMSECLKGLNWHALDSSEVRVDADIKDGGMMLLTALFPYASWLCGSADIILHVRGSIEQPILDGSAYFHRASVSSPVLWKPLTNFGGTVHVVSNRLCINTLESRVGRRGKLLIRGNIALRTSEGPNDDKVDIRCDVLEVRARNIISGQVDTQMQVTGSILKPNIYGKIQLSHGEMYLPHDKNGRVTPFNGLARGQTNLNRGGYNDLVGSRYVARFFGSRPGVSSSKLAETSGEHSHVGKAIEQEASFPRLEMWLSNLKLVLGPELRIVYPLILNFAVSGEVELNGVARPRGIKPKGVLTFENGDVNLVATQVRLKREHLNVAKFEPDNGLDPLLDLALVGSEWQLKIRGRASNWQDNLVVTSTHSVEQDVLSASEAARVFENQLAESILEGDGQLAFKKLATSTLERLMPRIEGKGKFGQARWRLVYAPQIPSLVSTDPSVDPLKSIASNISFGTEVEVHLGKRIQASIVREMKDSEMAMQWTLIYQLTSRLRVVLQSAPSKRLLFEYSTTSQD